MARQPLNNSSLRDSSLLVPDSRRYDYCVIITALSELHSATLAQFSNVQDYRAKICCSYASAIAAEWPQLKSMLVDVLAENGIGPVDVKIPSQAEANSITIVNWPLRKPAMIVLLGQLCLIPYIDLASVNYLDYISRSATVMRAFVCIRGVPSGLIAISDVDKVHLIKSMFGVPSATRFKDMLLSYVRDEADRPGFYDLVFAYIDRMMCPPPPNPNEDEFAWALPYLTADYF